MQRVRPITESGIGATTIKHAELPGQLAAEGAGAGIVRAKHAWAQDLLDERCQMRFAAARVVAESPRSWSIVLDTTAEPAPENREVKLTAMSTGARFEFEER